MHADFSVELGHDDPVLEIPWKSDDGTVRYYDLRKNPEAIAQITEAVTYPELGAFLKRVNAAGSHFETAKCDVWQSKEIAPEEEIFGAGIKFASYVDLLFVSDAERHSFIRHEMFAKELCALLSRAPDIAATVELVIRRCYCYESNEYAEFSDKLVNRSVEATNYPDAPVSSFYMTLYIAGFGNEDHECHRVWAIAVSLLQHALLQLKSD